MTTMLRACFDNMDGDYAGAGHPEFWVTGGKAGMLNSAAITVIAQEMNAALLKTGAATELEL